MLVNSCMESVFSRNLSSDSVLYSTKTSPKLLNKVAEISLCSNHCFFSKDGICDDGGSNADYSVCDYGSDCADCGVRFETSSLTSATPWWWNSSPLSTWTSLPPSTMTSSPYLTLSTTTVTTPSVASTTIETTPSVMSTTSPPYTTETNKPSSDSGCGDAMYLTADSGTFTTMGFGKSRYDDNAKCEWHIRVPHRRIKLVIGGMDVAGCCDFIRVFDGGDEMADLLGEFNNDTPFEYAIVSSGSELFVRFTSQVNKRNGDGFSAEYTSFDIDDSGCVGPRVLTKLTDVIQTPPAGYDEFEYCEWLISPLKVDIRGSYVINLSFETVDLDTGDSVRLYDGKDDSSPLVAVVDSSPAEVNFTSGSATIVFRANRHSEDAKFGGFYATYTITEVEDSGCGNPKMMTNPAGSFSSMHFFEDFSYYDNNMICEWDIIVEVGKKIEIDFSSMALEKCCDFVYLYEEIDYPNHLIDKFSGDCASSVVSSGNHVFVRFVSDSHVVDKGFSATYRVYEPDFEDSGCGGPQNLYVSDAAFMTLHYGKDLYPNLITCEWKLHAKTSEVIRLTFADFLTEECCDIVRVYDGPTADFPLLGMYSGNLDKFSVTPSRDVVLVTFTSDSSVRSDGFMAYFEDYNDNVYIRGLRKQKYTWWNFAI
ncbi:scavenger receptor cysteine-rich domain-containing protein DMBT1-like [Ptychodera flava]|uniref:scavenger receptor cysteine-rich domain-containing protein DMBT1-like n=1 Tax=Ptychodera flava TaxID=63121 RepID=UPI00396A2034